MRYSEPQIIGLLRKQKEGIFADYGSPGDNLSPFLREQYVYETSRPEKHKAFEHSYKRDYFDVDLMLNYYMDPWQNGGYLYRIDFRETPIQILKKCTGPIIRAFRYTEIQALEAERLAWSLKTFPDATPISSLRKLEEEIKEVENDIINGAINSINEEYADCLMCLFDSAGRLGITPQLIFEAFALKFEKNKNRTWYKNPDNTYSHKK